MEEATAFWSYYESLGWKNNKGAAIVSKIAAARMWRRQFGTQDPPHGADAWYRAASTSSIDDPVLWRVFAGAEREESGAVCRLRCTEKFERELMKACPGLLAILQRCWNVPAVRIERMDH